jgi:GMP synthase-like glutamine amidotransferase
MIKLGILEAGQNRPEFIKTHGTMGEWFIPFLQQASKDYTFNLYEAYRGQLPDRVEKCSAYLITGSAHSVYEKMDWLDELSKFIIVSARQVPVIGICFGHQLLHRIFGGRVEASDRGWGIGVHEYRVYEHPDWMQPAVSKIRLLASHHDQVLEPAKGSRTLAGSSFCPVAASTIGKNILTIQPHPEMDKEFAQAIFKMRYEEQGADVTNTALSSMNQKVDDDIAAKWITNFLNTRLSKDIG